MQNRLIKRQRYLDEIIKWKDQNIIKVITGVRRSGKSTLFKMYIDYLVEQGISKKQIMHINLDSKEYRDIVDENNLHDFVNSKLVHGEMNYVFVDEVQNIPNFELALNSLYIKENVDLYVTGSNAYLLSSELATKISGRYIEIKILPISFKEYFDYKTDEKANPYLLFNKYLNSSSFPYAIELEDNKEMVSQYLSTIFDTIVIKDISKRFNITNYDLLEKLVIYLADNIGNIISPSSIANYLTSKGLKTNSHTISNYLKSIISSFIFYRSNKYDVKGKKIFDSGAKYYMCDLGLRKFVANSNSNDYGRILENIVFLELLRRNYKVTVGFWNDYEIDFIALKGTETIYVQVCLTLNSNDSKSKTFQRESKAFLKLPSAYKKIIITNDFVESNLNIDGIQIVNIVDWLLNTKY